MTGTTTIMNTTAIMTRIAGSSMMISSACGENCNTAAVATRAAAAVAEVAAQPATARGTDFNNVVYEVSNLYILGIHI